jgi:hypothetical protein
VFFDVFDVRSESVFLALKASIRIWYQQPIAALFLSMEASKLPSL